MKTLVTGIVRRAGTSKKSNQPYDFTVLIGLRAIEQVNKENRIQHGHGYEPIEIQATSDAVESFAGIKFPAELELETEAKPGRNGLELVVTSLKGKAAA